MRTDVNFETVKEYTLVWFDDLMEVHKSKIEMSIETGNMVYSNSLKEDTKNWLEKLTQKYNDMVINIEIYDFEQVKKLYQQLDDLYSKIDFKYSMTLKKLKKLKIDLMEASSDNNFIKIREVVKKIKELEI